MIKYKARKLVGQHGFTRDDQDDLEQELALHAVIASVQYNSGRGAKSTFYSKLIERKATDLTLRNTRQKRDRRRERPLDHGGHVTGATDPIGNTELRIDIDSALANADPVDRAVAAELKVHNVAGVARQLGLSRQTVRSAQGRIHRLLEKSGVAA